MSNWRCWLGHSWVRYGYEYFRRCGRCAATQLDRETAEQREYFISGPGALILDHYRQCIDATREKALAQRKVYREARDAS